MRRITQACNKAQLGIGCDAPIVRIPEVPTHLQRARGTSFILLIVRVCQGLRRYYPPRLAAEAAKLGIAVAHEFLGLLLIVGVEYCPVRPSLLPSCNSRER